MPGSQPGRCPHHRPTASWPQGRGGRPQIVFVDEHNQIITLGHDPAAAVPGAGPAAPVSPWS